MVEEHEARIDVSFQGSVSMQRFAFWVLCASVTWFALPSPAAQACDNCIAKQKAAQQASEGRMRHVGGSMGQGRYEGVGFSTVSADDAIRKCCFYGQRSPVGVGVARGNNGWYATVLYR
jgi:hypothetical protein